jgi:hypothetical protein
LIVVKDKVDGIAKIPGLAGPLSDAKKN